METTSELEKVNGQLATTPDDLLALAVNNNLDIEKLEKLLAMKERWDAVQAKKAFFNALTNFQEQCPEIRKSKSVDFDTRTGNTHYNFAPLGDIDRQIKKLLKESGLSKNWKFKEGDGKIKVICIISHVDGHSEETELDVEADTSGSKNAIQAKGSAISYGQRYTLVGALGLTTVDQDIDGRLPEMDIDKLHKNYMDLYNQIVLKDESFRTPGDPDNWQAERTAGLYVAAIGKARQRLAKLTLQK